jgi:hypothetical protein
MNSRTLKLLLAGLSLTAVACDPYAQQMSSRGAVEELAPASEGQKKPGDCSVCMKWSAKPPGGVNSPPWSF